MKTIYIAGPMTDIEDLNKIAFYQIEAKLIKNGWETINPHKLGNLGLNPEDPYYFPRIMRRDFEKLENCNAIYMMDGWEFSPGASCEHAYAKVRDLDIYYEVPLPQSPSYGDKDEDEDLENIENYGGSK